MKNTAFFVTAAILFLVSCSKKNEMAAPVPASPVENSEAGFSLSLQLPAGTEAEAGVATLVMETSGQEKIVKVTLVKTNDKMNTGLIILPQGKYQLTQLKIADKNGVYVYAAPKAQSPKAAEVATPLAFELSANTDKPLVNLAVSNVTSANVASDFGYPKNAFDGQDQVKIKLKASINVGGYVYDNMDGQLQLTWQDAQNQAHTEQIQLTQGENEIGLSKNANSFVFEYRKWNVTDKMEMPASEIEPGTTIIIGGSVTARKLSEEKTWNESNGDSRYYSRKTYEYNGADQLVKTMYYQKLPQYQDLQLQQIHEFEYTFGKLTQVNYFDGNHKPTGYIKFTLDNNGLVTNMEQKSYDQLTYAAVDYGMENNSKQVTIDYLYNNGHSLEYKYWIENGNKTRETGTSSTGGSEGGNFEYDNYINPYYLLGVQDIYLRHSSRNNLVQQNKNYSGGFPTSVPYGYEYNYDAAGYPVQLQKKFKTYPTGTHQYTARTEFTYKN